MNIDVAREKKKNINFMFWSRGIADFVVSFLQV